jgi:hypothetical protein
VYLLEQAHKNRDQNRSVFSLLLQQIYSDIALYSPLERRAHRTTEILDCVQKNRIEKTESISSLEQLHNFLEGLKEEKQDSAESGSQRVFSLREEQSQESEIRWEDILNNRTFSDPREIEEAIDTIAKTKTVGPRHLPEPLERIKSQCQLPQYRPQLEALISVNPHKLPYHSLLKAIKDRLADWSFHPSVKQWRQESAEKILRRWFPEFVRGEHFSQYRLDELATTFAVDRKQLLASVPTILPEYLEELSASALYEIAEAFIPSLPSGGAKSVLSWILPRLSSTLREDLGDGPWRENLLPPRSAEETLSGFLWSAFGHPDKRTRWRAAHAVRRLVRLGQPGIIHALIRRLEDQHCLPFRKDGHPFYWLSARLWLFILLDRLAREAPEAIYPHADLIAHEALEPEVPHALIRHFAKRAALVLAEHKPLLYSASQLADLRKVCTSPYDMISTDRTSAQSIHRERNARKERKERFSFDSMDTLPYWYDPLGEIFGVSAQDIATAAEDWICDKWGYSGSVWKIDPLMKAHDFDGLSTLNRHGSEPIIERLQIYLEYHAMFCVADRLLTERPIIEKWGENPWESWFRRWNLTWEDTWLADRRDPTPLERQFWEIDRADQKTWRWEISSLDFDHALGLITRIHTGSLVVDAYQHRYYHKDYETLCISSALVSLHTAQALLQALQTTNSHSYWLPSAGDESEIDIADFELKGWLKNIRIDFDGIDESDPLRNQLSSTITMPGQLFTEWARLHFSKDTKKSWREDHPEKTVTLFEHWDDCPQTDRAYGFKTEGSRLWINIDELLRFLKESKFSLIIACRIDRHSERHDNIEDIEGIPGYAKLYLIRSNGTIETLGGSSHLGRTAC